MKMYLTEGMFGRKVEQIGKSFKTFSEAMDELDGWKKLDTSTEFFKIESYNRLLFDKENDQTAIDFGDYHYFILLDKNCDEEMKNG